MHVVDDLGVPGVMHLFDHQPRLLLAENVPVAIVVVADILVIELRHRSRLVGSTEPAAIPRPHLVDTVRIQRRHQQENRVREDRAVPRRVLGQQVVGELDGRHRRGHFGGMDRARDHHGRLALRGQFHRRFRRRPARVCQLGENVLVPVQGSDRRGIGDRSNDHRPPLGGFAQVLDAHRVAGSFQAAEIAHHVRPADQLAILAHGVAEVGLWRGQRTERGQYTQQEGREAHRS